VKLRTSDGQTFDAWVNSPENERAVPKWLGQIGVVSETRTEITAPDGSQLSIGPGEDQSGDAAEDTGAEDGAVSPSPRRRGKK
jgi:hypothetical protein